MEGAANAGFDFVAAIAVVDDDKLLRVVRGKGARADEKVAVVAVRGRGD